SRDVAEVVSVDKSFGCFQYLKTMSKTLNLPAITPFKADVLKFLRQHKDSYDIIFADPPYDLPQLRDIPQLVFEKELLRPEGLLILEHPTQIQLDSYPQFIEQRKYGNSTFSFFMENKG